MEENEPSAMAHRTDKPQGNLVQEMHRKMYVPILDDKLSVQTNLHVKHGAIS